MTVRVGPKGQVVIPKALRERLGISPGDEVDVTYDNDAVRVEVVRDRPSLRGRFAGRGLVAELEGDHQRELTR